MPDPVHYDFDPVEITGDSAESNSGTPTSTPAEDTPPVGDQTPIYHSTKVFEIFVHGEREKTATDKALQEAIIEPHHSSIDKVLREYVTIPHDTAVGYVEPTGDQPIHYDFDPVEITGDHPIHYDFDPVEITGDHPIHYDFDPVEITGDQPIHYDFDPVEITESSPATQVAIRESVTKPYEAAVDKVLKDFISEPHEKAVGYVSFNKAEAEPFIPPRAKLKPPGHPAPGTLSSPGTPGQEHEIVRRVNQALPEPSGMIASEGPEAKARPPFARELSAAVRRDRRALLAASPEELRAELVRVFEQRAYTLTLELLQENEQITHVEAGHYAESFSGEETPAHQLRQAASELGGIQQAFIPRYQELMSAAMAQYGATQGTARAESMDEYLELPITRRDPVLAPLSRRYLTLKRIYGASFPILLQSGLDYTSIAQSDPATLERFIADSTAHVLSSIGTMRKEMTPDRIWSLLPVVERTRQDMGIAPGTPADRAITEHAAAREVSAAFEQIALAALGIGLAIGAIVASGGLAAPGVAAVLGAVSAGVSVYSALEESERYRFEHAAHGASLDPATLAQEDPSLVWLAVAILGAVVDVGAAGLAFRNLAATARLARQANALAELEEAARAEARVLRAQGKLQGTEADLVRRIMASAHDEGAARRGAEAGKSGKALALPRSLGAARHPLFARLEAVLKRYGASEKKGGYLFPSRRAARQAASEILGDLGGSPKVMRLRDFEGLPDRFEALARKQKSSLLDSIIGRQRPDGSAGWRDDFLGHVFKDKNTGETIILPPHVNIWDKQLGFETHLFYSAGSPGLPEVRISW
jgi:hypothetical protein